MTDRLRITGFGNGRVTMDTILPFVDAINEALNAIETLNRRVGALQRRVDALQQIEVLRPELEKKQP